MRSIFSVLYLLGDRYEEEPRSRRSGQKLDDINDWDSGGGPKNIAQEAIGKVKDLINRARGFDEPPEPYE